MTYKKSEEKSVEEQKAAAEKLADSIVPASAGKLLNDARKADTRADADRMTNQLTDPNAVNLVKQLEVKPAEKEVKKKPLSDAEYERRTRLDVSNPDYINPSLDHYK